MSKQKIGIEDDPMALPGPQTSQLSQSAILKEIRSWALALLVLGILHIIGTGFLSAPWGIFLILVGLASFYFRSSAMMVVYAITLAWAGITNITSGQLTWIAISLLQWFFAYQIFHKFFEFRKAEANSGLAESEAKGLTPERSASAFPWAAGIIGILSLIGFVGILAGAVVYGIVSGGKPVPGYLEFLENLAVNFGVLGFGVGLASILSKHPRRGLSICGMVTGLLTVLAELFFVFLSLVIPPV